MYLLISENDQIIGADEEFLGQNSLENLKENFSSMSIYFLQSEHNNFDFEYLNSVYTINKSKIFMDTQNAYLYQFSLKETKEQKSEEQNLNLALNDFSDLTLNNENEIKNSIEEQLSVLQPEIKDIEPNIKNDLNISFEENINKTTQLNNSTDLDTKINLNNDKSQELTLDIGLDNNNSDEIKLDIGIDDTEKENNIDKDNLLDVLTTEKPKELELEIDFDSSNQESNYSNETPVLEIDLGLNQNENENDEEIEEITISQEEITQDLQQASQDLDIDNQTILQFFEDFKQQLIEEKVIIYNAINNEDFDTLHKSCHKLKGVALNLRLHKLAELFKMADEFAKNKKNIEKIKSIIDNIFNVINKIEINLDFDLPQEDKEILFKSFYSFLEEIKDKDIDTIKKELENAYALIPIHQLKNVSNIDSKTEIDTFIENLQQNIKKEF